MSAATVRWLMAAMAFMTAPAAAQLPERLHLGYDIAYSGVTIAVLEVDLTVNNGTYVLYSYTATTGLFSVLLPLVAQARTEGRLTDTGPVPVHHRSETRAQGSVRTVTATFRDGRLANFERRVEPPDPRAESRVPDSDRVQSIDAASALLALSLSVAQSRGCETQITSFDGRRLHHVRFTDGGVQRLPQAAPNGFGSQAMLCNFVYESRDGPEAADAPRRGRVWIARINSNGAAAPLRVELETSWGTASVRLRTPASLDDTAGPTR